MTILHQSEIAVFNDSFNSDGMVFQNDGPFGMPLPHLKMKRLRHHLTLTVEGPSDLRSTAEGCLQKATTAGAVAAVAGSFIGAGIGATGAALTAFQAQFIACAGEQVSLRLDDRSEWIYWTT